jgi:hypothetical protein
MCVGEVLQQVVDEGEEARAVVLGALELLPPVLTL